MPQERLVHVLLLGLVAVYLGIAAYVLIDDARCRRELRGRYARLDQIIVDAEEHFAVDRLGHDQA